MIKEAKGFGNTIDEAKENAIKELDASDFDDIQFEVISMPKKKVLGIFGGSEAEVRAYVELPDKKNKEKKNQNFKKEKPVKNPEKPQKPAKVQEKAEEKAPAKPEPVKPTSVKPVPEYGEPIDADSIPADSNTGKAIAYIRTVLKALNCENTVIKVATRENASLLLLDGEDLNILIGRRGETLDALQYLAGLAANNGGGHYKISINVGNYRQKREETLTALAARIADQAIKSGKCRTLEPMNPYERRIIHTAIQAIDGVKSASFGEGAQRRVVIAPDGVDFKPRTNDGNRHSGGHRPHNSRPAKTVSQTPDRAPKKDSDVPLYGKIN